jgi:hypothetical protein
VVSFDTAFNEGYIQIDNLKNVKALAPIGNTNAAFSASSTLLLNASVVKSDPLSLVVAVGMKGTGSVGFETQANQIEEADVSVTSGSENSRILIAKNLVDGNIRLEPSNMLSPSLSSPSVVTAEILPG